jgi:hypothetical protein
MASLHLTHRRISVDPTGLRPSVTQPGHKQTQMLHGCPEPVAHQVSSLAS